MNKAELLEMNADRFKIYFRASSILLYLLAIVFGFLITALTCKFLGVGKNQGLAAAAIVIMYAFMGALACLIFSVILIKTQSPQRIRKFNVVLAIMVFLACAYIKIDYDKRMKDSEYNNEIQKPPMKALPEKK